jgi:hypothetical protein
VLFDAAETVSAIFVIECMKSTLEHEFSTNVACHTVAGMHAQCANVVRCVSYNGVQLFSPAISNAALPACHYGCNRSWMHLESIFGALNIQKQLGQEAKIFTDVAAAFKVRTHCKNLHF